MQDVLQREDHGVQDLCKKCIEPTLEPLYENTA